MENTTSVENYGQDKNQPTVQRIVDRLFDVKRVDPKKLTLYAKYLLS